MHDHIIAYKKRAYLTHDVRGDENPTVGWIVEPPLGHNGNSTCLRRPQG